MPKPPLIRLREIRKARENADALLPERNEKIVEAAAEGKSQRAIADAAGIDQAHVNRILKKHMDVPPPEK